MEVPLWASDPDMLRDVDPSTFTGSWEKRRWMNLPGPFYTGEADFALLGPTIAPQFIGVDEEGVDVVFRQPVSQADIDRLTEAAWSDPLGGYGADGNARWTVTAVRDWWRRSTEIVQHIEKHLLDPGWWGHGSDAVVIAMVAEEWKRFLWVEAEAYLQAYCYFLENGRWPSSGVLLPEV